MMVVLKILIGTKMIKIKQKIVKIQNKNKGLKC